MSSRRWHPPLAPEDLALWEQVKAGVRPLHRRRSQPLAAARPKLAAEEGAPKPPPAKPAPVAPPVARKPAPPASTLDKALAKRVKRGAEPITRRLDLHGMRQEEAHRQLLAFLRAAQQRGDRVILLITGKGIAGGGDAADRGVLRRAVPRWLKLPEFHALVVGFASAEQAHGGAGALYVHVRRARHLE